VPYDEFVVSLRCASEFAACAQTLVPTLLAIRPEEVARRLAAVARWAPLLRFDHAGRAPDAFTLFPYT